MKYFILTTLLCFSFFPFVSNSQAVEWLQDTPAGSSRITTDQFSNVYSCGKINNTPATLGGITYTTNGGLDVLIVKKDQLGNVMWATQIGNATDDNVSDIAYDGFGNVWIVGTFYGTLNVGSSTLTAIGGKDMYVAKLSASTGNILFAASGGGSNNEDNGRINADAQGNIYVAGNHNGNFVFEGQGLSGYGGYDVYLLKLNNAGGVVYISGYHGASSDSMHSMTIDDANNVYIIGVTTSTIVNFNGVNQNITYPSGVYVYNIFTKFDANGDYVYHKETRANGEIVDCSTDAFGNLYFTGNTGDVATFGALTVTSNGNLDDILLGKMLANGTFDWVKSIGGTSNDNGYCILTNPQGDSYVAARYQGIVDFEVEIADGGGFSKSCVIKLDNAGNVTWAVLGSGANPSWSTGIAMTPNETIYSCGPVYDDLTMGQETISNGNSYLVKITGNSNIAKGTVYLDLNSNGTQEPGEIGIPNVLVEVDNSNYVSSTNNNGNYQSYLLPGNYSLSIPNPPLYHTLTSASTQSANFVGYGQVDPLNDFGFVATPGMNDLTVDIVAITNPKAGYVMGYQVTYKNVGTTDLNASIEFTADNLLTFVNSNPSVTSTTGNVFTYDLGLVSAQTQGNITILFQIPTSANIGDPVTSSAAISPLAMDQTPSNNVYSITRLVTGPYDPNYKEVSITEFVDPMDAEVLEYTIHFQNLGNAAAQNVIILDTLSDYLVNSSAEIISTSHTPMNFSIEQGNVAKFDFQNIQLPDSLSDPIGSMGFVKFRIKQDMTVPVNSTIDNFGDIYFDYNPPITTNVATTIHLSESAGILDQEASLESLNAFPVPAKSEVMITFNVNKNEQFTLTLMDMNGREVQKMEVFPMDSSVLMNLDNVNPGVYFIHSNGLFETKKIIVQ